MPKQRMSLSALRDCDVIANFVGVTPKYDSTGQIVPVGRPSKKGKVYVVFRGRAIGLFSNWGICKAMVAGYSATSFQSFSSLKEAREAWAEGPEMLRSSWSPPKPRPPHYTTHPPPTPETMSVSANYTASDRADLPTTNPSPQASDNAEPLSDVTDFTLVEPARVVVDMSAEVDAPRARSPSPTLSSVSSVSASSVDSASTVTSPDSIGDRSPTLTEATISARTIDTPILPSTLSLPLDPYPATSRASRRYRHSEDERTPPASSRRARGQSTPPGTPTPASSHKKKGKGKGKDKFEYDKVVVSQPKQIYVVVRGENPGIYFDWPAAVIMLGRNPGMKLVIFDSLSRAAWYFVKQYMAKEVGVPVLADDDDGVEEGA